MSGAAVMTEDRLTGLRVLCPAAAFVCDGGKEYVSLPNLRFTSDNNVVEVNALLCPSLHSGYPTRLFLARPFANKGLGGQWSVHTICGQTWHTWSWGGISADLPLLDILLGHLRALR